MDEERLLKLGCPQDLVGILSPLLSEDSYTDKGVKQLILGFTTLTRPKKLDTVSGEGPIRLSVIKAFMDYKEKKNDQR